MKKGKRFSVSIPGVAHPILLRAKTSDQTVLRQIFFKKEYDLPYEVSPSVIIDTGANIGLTSIYFANKYPQARIVSVEPEDGNYALLCDNVQHYANIEPMKVGIWNKRAHVEIVDNPETETGFQIKEVSGPTQRSLETVSIGDILEQKNISNVDILKMDIEGSEKEVFEAEVKSWISKVDVLVIEFHDRMKAGTAKSFFEAIHGLNYQLEVAGDNLAVRFIH
ncbi:MAG: FkbM family methyltransferase [Bacteroidia bacterium]